MNDLAKRSICGAKTRGGKPCKRAPAPGKRRCRLHGGASTGPKAHGARPGNSNARKHGLFSKRLTAEETAMLDSIPVGSLDDVLRLVRIMLVRLFKEQRQFDGKPTLYAVTEYNVPHRRSGTLRDVTRRVPDYTDVSIRLLGRIGELELQRARLLAVGRNGDRTAPPPAVPVVVIPLSDAAQFDTPHGGKPPEHQA